MTYAATLTSQELALLGRIDAGDNLASASNMDRQLAYALAKQHLVRVTLAGAVRGFVLTGAGRELLHGPAPHTARSTKPKPTQPQARALIEQIAAAHGILHIHNPHDSQRAAYLRMIRIARERGLVPAGYRLLYTGRDTGDLILHLAPNADAASGWNRIRLTQRQHTSDPDVITSLLRRHRDWFGLDHRSHQRAIILIEHLGRQARQYGCQLILSTKASQPRLWLQAGRHRRTIAVTTAAAIAAHLRRHRTVSLTACQASDLAVVASRDRWHHQAWTEDDRSLAIQAADIVSQITASIEHDRCVAEEFARMRLLESGPDTDPWQAWQCCPRCAPPWQGVSPVSGTRRAPVGSGCLA